MQICWYAGLRVSCAGMQQEVYGYRACDFVISGSLSLRSGLLFSHPKPLGIGYQYHSFVDASCYRVLYIGRLVPWFLSHPMPLGIRELEHCFRD